MTPPPVKPARSQDEVNSYPSVLALMKEIGARNWDPIPPDQHAAMMGTDQPPFTRYWGAVLHHTIHIGYRSAYCISKDGHALTPEQVGEFLGMDVGNARLYFRTGVARGLWRAGTQAEGSRRVYLRGKVPPLKGEDPTDPRYVHTLIDDYPPYQREAIKALPEDKQKAFLAEDALVSLRGKDVLADLVAAGRAVINKDHDTVFLRFGIPKIRETHKNSASEEEAKERQARLAKIIPIVEQYVLTFDQSEQTGESGVYPTSYNDPATPPSLFALKPLDLLESGRLSQSPSHSTQEPHPDDGGESVNQQPAPQNPATATSAVRSEIQKNAARAAREKAERERAAQGSKKTPSPHKAAVAEMFDALEKMQAAYPRSDFSAEHVNRDNAGDVETVGQIVEAINLDVIGFCLYIAAKFKGLSTSGAPAPGGSRSPEFANGPKSLGLVLSWAKDYRRQRRGRGVGEST
jgi:hypothetical protein